MPTSLYLDTARFGRTRRYAWYAQQHFLRLCAEEGAPPTSWSCFADGYTGWSEALRRRYRGLADWPGVTGLKEAVRRLAGAPGGSEVLVSQRSAVLMRLAARAVSLRCRRVLHTDLEWPGYRELLQAEQARGGGEVVCVPVRAALLDDKITVVELVDLVAHHYWTRGCDGLFLSAISFEGIRFPVAELLRLLIARQAPRLVVIDGAQALGHAPFDLAGCDIYLAGCHKWLQSGHPLGLAVLPRRCSRSLIEEVGAGLRAEGPYDDPLLAFTRQLERDDGEPFGETVGLVGLFGAAAAIADVLAEREGLEERFQFRLSSGRALADLAAWCGWQPIEPAIPFRSAIRLLRPGSAGLRAAPPEPLRAMFQRRGIAVTTYAGGVVRMSAGWTPWVHEQIEQLSNAFRYGF